MPGQAGSLRGWTRALGDPTAVQGTLWLSSLTAQPFWGPCPGSLSRGRAEMGGLGCPCKERHLVRPATPCPDSRFVMGLSCGCCSDVEGDEGLEEGHLPKALRCPTPGLGGGPFLAHLRGRGPRAPTLFLDVTWRGDVLPQGPSPGPTAGPGLPWRAVLARQDTTQITQQVIPFPPTPLASWGDGTLCTSSTSPVSMFSGTAPGRGSVAVSTSQQHTGPPSPQGSGTEGRPAVSARTHTHTLVGFLRTRPMSSTLAPRTPRLTQQVLNKYLLGGRRGHGAGWGACGPARCPHSPASWCSGGQGPLGARLGPQEQ